jgi:hypothetical protein
MLTPCRVRGCENEASAVFLSTEIGAEYPVCSFHLQALGEGEPWHESFGGPRHEILMGEDIPVQFIGGDWKKVLGSGGHHIILTVRAGRDGISEATTTFGIEPDAARQLAKTLMLLAGDE